MRRTLKRTRLRILRRSIWQSRLVFWGGALLVGLAAGGFARLAGFAEHSFRAFIAAHPYSPLAITPLGLLLVTFVVRTCFAGAEGSGVPQALAAVTDRSRQLGQRFLTLRIAAGKFLLCVVGLLCGASLGRVGPTIHIGAAIMYSIGKYMHFRQDYMLRGLVMAGGGAGIAAAFNLPLAGIMFAIEEMGRSFDRRSIGMIVITIIVAAMVSILVHDTDYHFALLTSVGDDVLQLAFIVVFCGVIGGLVGGGFSRVLVVVSQHLVPHSRRHWVAASLLCGLLIAVTGIVSGGTAFGSGYSETRAIIDCAGSAACAQHPGVLYPVYKLIATVATFISGIPAGLFVPVLATGAGIGSDIAMLFAPELASAIILIAMVAYYSGVMQTPITAFIVVMEITGNNDLVFALIAAALIGSGVSRLVCRNGLFTMLASGILRELSADTSASSPARGRD